MSPPTRWLRRAGFATLTALTLTTGFLATAAQASPAAPVRHVCAAPAHGHASCLSLIRTDVTGHHGLQPLDAVAGYGPPDLRSAYALPTAGAGQTVAIIDAFDDPNAESDLATYRSQFGLPACTTANGCFRKVNQNGAASPLPKPDAGWAGEISLDVDMVSAVCPLCKILLVEANTPSNDLFTAIDTAARMGAKFISNSWGGGESAGQDGFDQQHLNKPGVAITASSGDNGFGVIHPASSRFVTAVGGTSLRKASNARGWSETAWNGAGSGCSAYNTALTGQSGLTGCSRRAVADVSAVADPNTGVAVYDTYGGVGGWLVFGGTSVAAPVVASIFALTGHSSATPQYPYANVSQFFDVVGGVNGTCSPSY